MEVRKKILKNYDTFLRVMQFAKPFWGFYLIVGLFSLFLQLIGLIHPWLLKIFLDDVLINQKFDLFVLVIIGFLLIFIVSHGFGFLSSLISTRFTQKQQKYIRTKIFQNLEHAEMSFFQKKKVGDLMIRLTSDTSSIQSYIRTIVDFVLVTSITFVATLVIAFSLSPEVTLWSMLVLPFYILLEIVFVKRLRKLSERLREKTSQFNSFIQESLSGIRVIKIFTQEKRMAREYSKNIVDINDEEYKLTITGGVSGLFSSLIFFLPGFFVFLVGGYQVMNGVLTIGAMMALSLYITRIFGPVASIATLNRKLSLNMVGINRIFEILDAPKEDAPERQIKVQKLSGEIVFDNVHFSYDGSTKILDGISETVKSGERIGLVGESGAGKSTLMNLLFQFYKPSSGKILIGGKNIDHMDLESFRKRIGYVSQQTTIFNRTLKENIAFGKPNASLKEIKRAARVAGVENFVKTLPKGYQTILGERGERLSGGQRQRVSLARVILEDPDIVVFDEPMSYLDPLIEEQIGQALKQTTKNKTVFYIAHSLSTIKNADELWFLSNGKIVEKGTFYELIANKQKFFHFFLSQFGGSEFFRNRLDVELDRLQKSQKPFTLLGISINNWNQIDKDPLKGNKKISEVTTCIASHLEGEYFFGDLPNRGEFVIAAPEVVSRNAKKISEGVAKHILSCTNIKTTPSEIISVQKLTPTNKEQIKKIVKQLYKRN